MVYDMREWRVREETRILLARQDYEPDYDRYIEETESLLTHLDAGAYVPDEVFPEAI